MDFDGINTPRDPMERPWAIVWLDVTGESKASQRQGAGAGQ